MKIAILSISNRTIGFQTNPIITSTFQLPIFQSFKKIANLNAHVFQIYRISGKRRLGRTALAQRQHGARVQKLCHGVLQNVKDKLCEFG